MKIENDLYDIANGIENLIYDADIAFTLLQEIIDNHFDLREEVINTDSVKRDRFIAYYPEYTKLLNLTSTLMFTLRNDMRAYSDKVTKIWKDNNNSNE